MDSFTITIGVLSLLAVCITVSVELRRLKPEAGQASTTLTALLSDVNGLRNILQLTETAFDNLEARGELEATQEILTLWQSLQQALHDGYETLTALETMLKNLSRNIATLDETRRNARFQAVTGQLVNHRQQIQIYRDAMQFSLQTIVFWDSVKNRNDQKKALSDMEVLDQNIDRLAANLEVKLQSLLDLFWHPDQQPQRDAMERLGDLVRAAALLYSSASIFVQKSEATSVDDQNPVTGQSQSLTVKESDGDFHPWSSSQTDLVTQVSIRAPANDESMTRRNHQSLFLPSQPSAPSTPPLLPSMAPPLQPTIPNPPAEDLSPSPPSSMSLSDEKCLANLESPPFSFPDLSSIQSENNSQGTNDTLNPGAATPTEQFVQSSNLDADPALSKARPGLFRRSRSHLESKSASKLTTNAEPTPAPPKSSSSKTKGSTVPLEVRRKFVFIGDGGCGKTSLLIKHCKGTFPEVYIPTVFENYVADVVVEGVCVEAALWDTAGQEDYSRLRPLSYPDAHIVCICFSIDEPPSLQNVERQWITEARHFMPSRPIILLGLKKDLREDPETIARLFTVGEQPVNYDQGYDMAKKIGAFHYCECSANTGEGVAEAFEIAAHTALKGVTGSKESGFKPRLALRKLLRI